MSTKPGTRSRKPRPTKSPLSPKATARILVTLFAGLPLATGLLVAKWFGWGVDGSLFGVMTGGIMVAVLLLVVLLQYESPRTRRPGRTSL
jgi:hypothetical protein